MILLPPAIRQHPVESLIAAALLLALLVGASKVEPNSEPNQKVIACTAPACGGVKPPH
jgi:hypothetical protein